MNFLINVCVVFLNMITIDTWYQTMSSKIHNSNVKDEDAIQQLTPVGVWLNTVTLTKSLYFFSKVGIDPWMQRLVCSTKSDWICWKCFFCNFYLEIKFRKDCYMNPHKGFHVCSEQHIKLNINNELVVIKLRIREKTPSYNMPWPTGSPKRRPFSR